MSTSIANSSPRNSSSTVSFTSPRLRRALWQIFEWIVCPHPQSMVIYYTRKAQKHILMSTINQLSPQKISFPSSPFQVPSMASGGSGATGANVRPNTPTELRFAIDFVIHQRRNTMGNIVR
jgi:hypothetical protein